MRFLLAALKVLGAAVIAVGFLTVAASLAVIVSAGLSKDGIPTFSGQKLLTIQGWSMEPAIRDGDLIVIRPLPKGTVAQEGDVITFRDGDKKLVTHRVKGILSVNQQPVWYVTKGDANQSEDLTTVTLTSVVGRYERRVPYAGYLLRFMQRPAGLIALAILPGIVLLVVIVLAAVRTVRRANAAGSPGPAVSQGGGTMSG